MDWRKDLGASQTHALVVLEAKADGKKHGLGRTRGTEDLAAVSAMVLQGRRFKAMHEWMVLCFKISTYPARYEGKGDVAFRAFRDGVVRGPRDKGDFGGLVLYKLVWHGDGLGIAFMAADRDFDMIRLLLFVL